MATRGITVTRANIGNEKASWTGLLNADDGSPWVPGVYGDMTIQVLGTFGVGGTLIVEGSNDGGTTYAPLTDPQGVAISFTLAGVEAILHYMERVRPRVTGGDGTTNLTAVIVARKPI